MYIRKTKITFIIFFTLAVFSSCSTWENVNSILSQTFKGNRLLPEGVSRIYIDKVSDGSISSTVKESFESSLKKRINFSGKLSLVETPENSDLTLKISLFGFSSAPIKFDSSGKAVENKLRLYAHVWINASSTGEEKVKRIKVEAWQFYSEINPPIMSEFNAITGLTDQMAERIVSVVITGWYRENEKKLHENR